MAVLKKKVQQCELLYSKTGQGNGQDSQKAFADDNKLTDGRGPNNLN